MPALNVSQIYGNISDVPSLVVAPNNATDGLYGIMIWAILYIILFITFTYGSRESTHPDKQGFLASSVVMSILSVLMATPSFQLINPALIVIPAVLSVVGILVVVRKNG